jgi:predicted RecA/RadA family phage recombinase
MSREAYFKIKTSDYNTGVRFTNNGTNHAEAAAIVAGQVVRIPGDANTEAIAGVAMEAIAVNATGMVDTDNVYAFLSASATTWAEGDEVWWNHEGNLAVASGTAAGATDVCLGHAYKAKVNGETYVWVRLNFGPAAFESKNA